jgi:EAL domain-containing protein (putative c-di-GMP-specific phosphodiesterase class I)
VLEHACRQAHAWRETGLDLVVSFNASPRQLQRPGFAAALRAQILGLGLDPARLVVEITESTAMRPSARTEAELEELSALGVELAIDDFGADYSSLCRLRELPVHLLKLDRSLLRGVPTDPNGAAIVSAVLALARGLGMRAIAEGVETAEQARFLTLADCPLAQGYHLGRPVPAEAITARLTRVAG